MQTYRFWAALIATMDSNWQIFLDSIKEWMWKKQANCYFKHVYHRKLWNMGQTRNSFAVYTPEGFCKTRARTYTFSEHFHLQDIDQVSGTILKPAASTLNLRVHTLKACACKWHLLLCTQMFGQIKMKIPRHGNRRCSYPRRMGLEPRNIICQFVRVCPEESANSASRTQKFWTKHLSSNPCIMNCTCYNASLKV
jgi:hypothetical protein